MNTLLDIIKYQWQYKRGKLFIPLFIYAMMGICVEVIYTALTSGSIVLIGHTSLWMFGTYIVGFTLINVLNDLYSYYKLPMWVQTIVGGLVIIIVEFISGLIILKLLGIPAWDYSNEIFNLWGIICLKSYVLFTLSVPLGIWLVDQVDWMVYRNPNNTNYPFWNNYKDLVTGK